MPKQIPPRELDAILTAVAGYPGGVPVGVIREALPYALPPRTLQRRLALLVEQKRLIADGRAKGRRYRVPITRAPTGSSVTSATAEAPGEVHVPLSPEAEAVKRAIRAAIQERRPVGYQRAFLDDYRPNVTHYLPAETRQRLLDLGRPPATSVRREPTPGRSTAAC